MRSWIGVISASEVAVVAGDLVFASPFCLFHCPMQGPQALASTSTTISLRGLPWGGGDEGRKQEEEKEEGEGEERRKGRRVKRKKWRGGLGKEHMGEREREDVVVLLVCLFCLPDHLSP